jgi:broad specificity phosphatase PhoE
MQDIEAYYYRHAQSEANLAPHVVGGRSNHSPLSVTGRHQAVRLGLHVASSLPQPDRVDASPAVRTVQTCELTLSAAGIDIHVGIDDRLQELSQGQAEGRPRSEVYTPEVFARIDAEGLDFKHAGGQSLRELGAQGLDYLNEAYEHNQATGVRVMYVFGHGMAIRSLVGRILGWDHMQILKHQLLILQ